MTLVAAKALIYTRVSQDRIGQARSVAEQEAECRAECARRGWQVIQVVTENDRSASRYAKRRRPEWERVKRYLAEGAADVLVTWEASRAGRDMSEFVKLRDLCVTAGVKLSYSGRVLDMSNSTDAFLGGLDALLAERESGQSSERIRRSTRAAATKGRPHGRRTFGYRRVYDPSTGALIGQEAEPAEAAVVVEIVDRVARGHSMRSLAWELSERGERTSTGGPWNATTVRRVARNLAYGGIRVHHGERHPADWPALVSVELVEAARARTDGNARGRAMPTSEVAHLLSGLLLCGRCGARLFRGHDHKHRHVYVCRERGARDLATGEVLGIGHLSVGRDPMDDLVTETVARWLERPDVAAIITEAAKGTASPLIAEAAVLRGRLDEAVTAFVAGTITASTLAAVEASLLPRIAAAERATRRAIVPPVVSEALGRDFRALTLTDRREVIAALVTITVKPIRKSRFFDPNRVLFDWNV